MAKITISLPDPLKDRLEQYAQQQTLPVSQVVQQALESFLEPPVPTPAPGPSSPPPPLPEGSQKMLEQIQRYLSLLRGHNEQQRQCLLLMVPLVDPDNILPLPPEMPAPPWEITWGPGKPRGPRE